METEARSGGDPPAEDDSQSFELVTTYYEIRSLDELRPAARSDLQVRRVSASPELARFFYTAVGGWWTWRDRLSWDYRRWQEHLDRPEVTTWVGFDAGRDGQPAGYFELEEQEESSVEIAYFGLLLGFLGRGFGGDLLTRAIREAFALGGRVWLHTCNLDGPAARANYEKRGFRQFRETRKKVLHTPPPGPWRDAFADVETLLEERRRLAGG